MKNLKKIIAMWRCTNILAKHCFLVALRAKFGKAPRAYVTKSLHDGGVKLLKTVNANCEISVAPEYRLLDKQIPKIFMSNHLSLFDLPVITAHIPEHIRVVIKKELTKTPFIGKAALVSEQIIIDRNLLDNPHQFYHTAKEKLSSGIALWIFPEGTRSRTGELLPFKLGGFRLAMETGAEIIPVAITGTNSILPTGKLMPHLNKKVSICIGKPLSTKNFKNINQLCEQTRLSISAMLMPV